MVGYNASISEKGKKYLEKNNISVHMGVNGTFYLPSGKYSVEVSLKGNKTSKKIQVK